MPRKNINFELDFMKKDIFPRFTVKQFDDVSFNIKPKNQGLDYDTTGMTGKIFVGVNNDMFMQTTGITVSSNNINVLLDKNMLQNRGRAYAEIELTDSHGTITSSSFIFNIDGKIGEGAKIPEGYEGFVKKYERLISQFKTQVNSTIDNCNTNINSTINNCNKAVDNKLNDVDNFIDNKILYIEKRFNTLTSSQQQDAEVIDARVGENGKNYASLGDRLNEVDSQLEHKANKGDSITVSQIDKNKGKFDQTYMTDEFLQQIAGDTPIHSVPKDRSITREKYALGSISLPQLDIELQKALKPSIEVTRDVINSNNLNLSVEDDSIIILDVITGASTFKTITFSDLISSISFNIQGAGGQYFTIGDETNYVSFNLLYSPSYSSDILIGKGVDNTSFEILVKGNTETTISKPSYQIPLTSTIEATIEKDRLVIRTTEDFNDYKTWLDINLSDIPNVQDSHIGKRFGFIYGGSSGQINQSIVATNISVLGNSYPFKVDSLEKKVSILDNLIDNQNNIKDVLFPTNIEYNKITTDELAEGCNNNNVYFENSSNQIEAQNTLNYTKDKIFLNTKILRFKVERLAYWIILGGTTENYSVLGLSTQNCSNNCTHQMADMINGVVNIRYYASNYVDKVSHLSLNIEDEIEILNEKNLISVNVKKQGEEDWVKWFDIIKSDFPNVQNFSDNILGFNFAISSAEVSSGINNKVLFSELYGDKILNNLDIIENKLEDKISNIENELEGKIVNIENKLENLSQSDKCAIVLVAGQSNAVGYDESPVNGLFNGRINPRIKQLGFKGGNNLKIIPLTHCAENYQDLATTTFTNANNVNTNNLGTKGIHLPLGNLLVKELPSDYTILFLPCAYGGTGFTTGASYGTYDESNLKPSSGALRWGVNSAYYKAMRDRLKYVLDMNNENIFLGVVWIQGENDKDNPNGHFTEFTNMTNDFFDYFNSNGYSSRTKKGVFDKDIWFNVETVAYWYGVGQCQTIWDNYREWNENTYVEIPRDTDSNATNGTGSTSSTKPSHFGNDAFTKVVAPRVFDKLKNNI